MCTKTQRKMSCPHDTFWNHGYHKKSNTIENKNLGPVNRSTCSFCPRRSGRDRSHTEAEYLGPIPAEKYRVEQAAALWDSRLGNAATILSSSDSDGRRCVAR
jgi:hypothetical protein